MIQFAVPLLVFLTVAWAVTSHRRRRQAEQAEQFEGDPPSDGTATFILILAIGATASVGLFVALGEWLA